MQQAIDQVSTQGVMNQSVLTKNKTKNKLLLLGL